MIRLDGLIKNYGKFRLDCTMEVKPGNITGLVGVNGAGFCEEFMLGRIIKILKAAYKNFDIDYFNEMCKKFELPYDVKIKEYSTGMKARLNLIIAMSHNAKLLILDEPTAGLDVLARNDMLDMLRDYVNDDRAILISSHISSDLEGICDDIYVIHDGSIILHQETDVILDEFGMLKLNRTQYESLDRKYIKYVLENENGFDCITDKRQFYEENYPDIVIQKGSIDDFLNIAERGVSI